ncbi:hypothetical protein Tco_0900085, partial [Tanacetum coccineum]
MVSSLNNNEIDFKISFDESDDEDYTVIFDKNSFSYKIISANDLKTDSENDNEKVNMPLFPSPEPLFSCIDDLDFFKDFENEFLAIVYNDALTSKSDFLTEPTLSPQHIDEFDLKDETSLSEYDEVEQNILRLNAIRRIDQYPYGVLTSDLHTAYPFMNTSNQRHQYLRYEGLQYTNANIVEFETRLARIYRREIKGLLVHELILEFFSTFRFGEAVLDLYTDEALQFQLCEVRRRISWREFILALGLHTAEEMHIAGFVLYWAESASQIPDKGDLSAYSIRISSAGDFLGTPPSYSFIRDPILRLCHRLIACSIARRSQAPEKVTVTGLFYLRGMDVDLGNVPYLLVRYLRLFTSGRKQEDMISGGQYIASPRPERQPDTASGAPEAAKDAPIADKGAPVVPALVQAPRLPPIIAGPAQTMTHRLARVDEDVHEIHKALGEQREILD